MDKSDECLSPNFISKLDEYYCQNKDLSNLFSDAISFFKSEFDWNITSGYTQENKPKFKLTLGANQSSKPYLIINPYKKSVQIRIGLNNNARGIGKLKKLGFNKHTYKNGSGKDAECLIYNFTHIDELNKFRKQDVEGYLLPKKVIGRSSKVEFDVTSKLDKLLGPDLEMTKSERDVMVKARIGQGKFRDQLIEYWGSCLITKCTEKSLLRASHIKPWRKCLDENKPQQARDPNNGLLLISNLDILFDKGYISFDERGGIIISNELDDKTKKLAGVKPNIKLNLTAEHQKYMEYHRDEIFDQFNA